MSLGTALCVAASLAAAAASSWTPGNGVQPHIVVILADDLGFNDVGWRNSNLNTTNLDYIAGQGIKFNKFYAHSKCSPSRAAMLTGRYAYRMGFNNGALATLEKGGLEKQFATMAETLNDNGYTSHMVGKWHLGWCTETYLPQNRGFSSYLGVHHSGSAHYDYTSEVNGTDVWQLFEAVTGPPEPPYQTEYTAGDQTYSTELYSSRAASIISSHDASSSRLFLYMAMQNIHGPQEAPTDIVLQYRGAFSWRKRRTTAAMVTALDVAIGEVVQALDDKGILDETVIVFASDNGGQPTAGAASNEPLRGGKNTWWEGGVRVPSMMYSPLLDSDYTGLTNECTFHITDWYPTLLGMAGVDTSSMGIDGIDQWDSITSKGTDCQRTKMFHNIVVDDNNDIETAAYFNDTYKLIVGSPGDLNGWYYEDGSEDSGDGSANYFLFDISDDEEERENLLEDDPLGIYEAIRDAMLDDLEIEKLKVYDFANSGRCDLGDIVSDDGEHYVFGCCDP